MQKNTLLQILLFASAIMIGTIIFFSYFYKGTVKEIQTQNEVLLKEINTNEESNLIKDLKYLSIDNVGNKYTITSKFGEINQDNPNIILMKFVEAKIELVNSDPIYIVSDMAEYNSQNYDTNFSKNVILNYIDHQIICEILDLLFKDSLAILKDKIVYSDSKIKLFADRLEIDLITKNSKISMNNQNEKVLILDNK